VRSSPRLTALTVAVVCIGLVVAQDVVPLVDFFHTWQYATALALGVVVMLGYLNGALRGQDGMVGRRLALALAGAVVATVTGIVSGLLGPDTQTVRHAPGSVAPIPDLHAAAFFTSADAATIANGTAHVILRRPNHADVEIGPNDRKFLGASVLLVEPSHAAFIEARDAAGNRLTITQPTNAAFLSPVLLFPNEQEIAGKRLPFDTFAVPALQRIVKAVLLPASMTTTLRVRPEDAGKPALLYAVDDEHNTSLGLTIDPDGREVFVAGLRLRATIGSYPTLVVASAPEPFALSAGVGLFIAGLLWAGIGLFCAGALPLRNPSGS
jgi:hypothetical protein